MTFQNSKEHKLSLKWKRDYTGPFESELVHGDYRIVVVGETSTGKPALWSIKKNGEFMGSYSKRQKRFIVDTFTKQSEAKYRVERELGLVAPRKPVPFDPELGLP